VKSSDLGLFSSIASHCFPDSLVTIAGSFGHYLGPVRTLGGVRIVAEQK